MKMTFRWYGKNNDKIKLSDIKQIPGVEGIVWALHHKMPGEVWEEEEIAKVKEQCDKYGFNIDVVENCDECDGHGGFDETKCSTCHGSGTVTSQRQTILGSFLSKSPCPDCGGLGKTYKRKCSECNGKGKIKKNKRITINIPAGVATGDRQRVSGKGNPGTNGGENGDLYLEYVVDEHEFYVRDNDDIYLEVPLTITEAVLGCKKTIPTLYGNLKLNIPSGTDSGDKQKIRGKGIDNEYRKHKGDMYVVFKVYVPKKLSKEQKTLIEKLSETNLETDETKSFNKFVSKNN